VYRVVGISVILMVLWIGGVRDAIVADASFYWEALDVHIHIEKTGDLLVTEMQTYIFTAPYARHRTQDIPLAQADAITDVSVLEGERELPVSVKRKGDQVRLRWRHSRNTSAYHTFTVQYRVRGSVRVHPQGDQFIWPALVAERRAPIKASSVTVHVPDALAGQLQRVRHYGVPADIRHPDAQTVTFAPRRALVPGEELSVKIMLPHGRLDLPASGWQQGREAAYELPGMSGAVCTIAYVVIGLGFFGVTAYVLALDKHERADCWEPGDADDDWQQDIYGDYVEGTYRPERDEDGF
jgi:Predicted membrane protein (DUF2207)